MSPGRAERHGVAYVRHGTLSLYAALNVGTGAVEGMTAAHHTSQEFVAFLERVVATQARRREIHLIADNLSAHKTQAVRAWLAVHPRVHMHDTPTYIRAHNKHCHPFAWSYSDPTKRIRVHGN